MSILKKLAFAAAVALAAQTCAAHASVVYDLSLIYNNNNIGGGSITLGSPPQTGNLQVSNYSQSAGTLTGLSITIGSDVFTLATEKSTSHPAAQFTSGVLDDVTYAGFALNGDGDSLQMTSQFVYFIPATQPQEIGSFTATLAPAVPEPSTWAMMILGFVSLGAMTYRRRKSAMLVA
jgi:opacity protein-like surface antigen